MSENSENKSSGFPGETIKKIKSFFSARSEEKRKDKKGTWSIWLISFILAFSIWMYAMGNSDTNQESSFDLIPIEYDNSQIKNYNLVVQAISIDTVNVKIMGKRNDMRAITADQISADISLEDIEDPGEYQLDVRITTPDRTTITYQTVERVPVTVDRPSERSFPIGQDDIILSGWTLEPGCAFGKPTVNATKVTVKGPTLLLETVDKVKVRTAPIETAHDNMTVSAEVVLTDVYGDEIHNSALSVSVNSDGLRVTLSVYKEKTVPLSVNCKYGYMGDGNVVIEPSSVVIKGSPDVVNGISAISVFNVDETVVMTDEDHTCQIKVPDGVTVSDQSGQTVTSAKVKVNVSDIASNVISLAPERVNLPAECGKRVRSAINITVRLADGADMNLLYTLSPEEITATASSSVIGIGSTRVPISVSLPEGLRKSVYIVGSYFAELENIPADEGEIR